MMENGLHVSLEHAPFSRYTQIFALWVGDEYREEAAWMRFLQLYRYYQTRLKPALNDYRREHPGFHACMAVENAAVLGRRLERIDTLRALGAAYVTLVWNHQNAFASSCYDARDEGLSALGRDALRRMNACGLPVDLSHASEKTFWEICERTTGPVLASHSCARALCGHPRNLTDTQFRALCALGGLVGINLYPGFLSFFGHCALARAVDHIEHFLALGGERHIALGSDMDGERMPSDFCSVGDLGKISGEMRRRGFTKTQIHAIMYRNAQRFFENNAKWVMKDVV